MNRHIRETAPQIANQLPPLAEDGMSVARDDVQLCIDAARLVNEQLGREYVVAALHGDQQKFRDGTRVEKGRSRVVLRGAYTTEYGDLSVFWSTLDQLRTARAEAQSEEQ